MAMKGLDELIRKMKELEKATAALDGEITSVGFDPHDPQSIELAIQQMEAAIDERVGDYSKNDMVQKIVIEMKERYRQAILDRAATGRTEGESES
ncbi:hypothetical protein [Acuticoccus sp.]|uniref:hypothetical protein n=1 Tax=Acuticoccus sp. TaxID=1904378 RepID=UPI003B526431